MVGNGKSIGISHIGNAVIHSSMRPILLKHVLHTPQISKQLMSVTKLCYDNQAFIEFYPSHIFVKGQASRKVLFQGILENGLYKVSSSITHSSSSATPSSSAPTSVFTTQLSFTPAQAFIAQLNNPILWHNKLRHPTSNVVSQVMQSFNLKFSKSSDLCSSCQLAKSHRLPFVLSESKAMKPFNLVHSDLWGPSPVQTVTGAHYFLLFIDDYSHFTWFYLLKEKAKLFSYFLKFKSLIENQFKETIMALQTDWGGKFRRLKTFLENLGIHHRHSCPYTAQQNGQVERKNRHIVEVGLSMLAHSSIPTSYWPYAFQYAVYLINRLPTIILHNKSPFKLLYNQSPSYALLQVFGCARFPFLRPLNQHKLQFPSKECVLLSLSSHHKRYLCLNRQTCQIYISRHVIFNEFCFPFTSSSSSFSPSPNSSTSSHDLPIFIPFPFLVPSHSIFTSSLSHPLTPSHPTSQFYDPSQGIYPTPSAHSSGDIPTPTPAALPQFALHHPPPPTNTHSMLTRSKAWIYKPKALVTAIDSHADQLVVFEPT